MTSDAPRVRVGAQDARRLQAYGVPIEVIGVGRFRGFHLVAEPVARLWALKARVGNAPHARYVLWREALLRASGPEGATWVDALEAALAVGTEDAVIALLPARPPTAGYFDARDFDEDG